MGLICISIEYAQNNSIDRAADSNLLIEGDAICSFQYGQQGNFYWSIVIHQTCILVHSMVFAKYRRAEDEALTFS